MVTWFLLIYYITGETNQIEYKTPLECKKNLERIYIKEQQEIGWIHCLKGIKNERNYE